MSSINEEKALIIKLLEKDVNEYRRLIPVIKSMNEEDFNKLMDGKKSYSFKVKNKPIFNMLVEKIENYKFITDWGYDDEHYKYLEELWLNYVCLEDLKNISDTELNQFLEKNNIHYSTWPYNIKSEFKKCISHTKETIIYKCKKMYQSLKGIQKLIIEYFERYIKYLDNIGLSKVKNLAEKMHMEVIGDLLLGGVPIGYSTYKWIKSNCIKPGYKNIFRSEAFSFLKGKLNSLVKTKQFTAVTTFIAIGNLIFSINNFLTIRDLTKKIDIYKSELDEINDSFYNHITKFDANYIFYSGCDLNNLCDNILRNVNSDLQRLESLINNINNQLKECEKRKIRTAIFLAGSLLVGIGCVVAAAVTGGTSIGFGIYYGVICGSNIASAGIDIATLVKNSKLIDELNEVLNQAHNLKNKIRKTIQDLNSEVELIKSFTKCIPTYRYF